VAASAVAGYITSPKDLVSNEGSNRQEKEEVTTLLVRHFEEFCRSQEAESERVSILPGFPACILGRLVFIPKDNLNTDGIYAGRYTYREDMTRDMMAQVIFDNYDPLLAQGIHVGDVIVGGFNFGTGSSREQAVTSLKARGIPLVIAGSFSQTYLRNAFNNGFLCIEAPALVRRLREHFVNALKGGGKFVISDDELAIDFAGSSVSWQGQQFPFPALGQVPQELVIAGGIENLVRSKVADLRLQV
jgi:homoaconitate hydratase